MKSRRLKRGTKAMLTPYDRLSFFKGIWRFKNIKQNVCIIHKLVIYYRIHGQNAWHFFLMVSRPYLMRHLTISCIIHLVLNAQAENPVSERAKVRDILICYSIGSSSHDSNRRRGRGPASRSFSLTFCPSFARPSLNCSSVQQLTFDQCDYLMHLIHLTHLTQWQFI